MERQHGVISRAQALACGLSDGTLAAHVRGRRWRRVFTSVYATFTGPLPRGSLLWAVILRAGPDATLSHETAAELVGLLDTPADEIHVTVPVARRVTPMPGVTVHRSVRAIAIRHPGHALPQSRPEETVLDLAEASRSVGDAVGWLTRALSRRVVTADDMRTALRERSRIRWRTVLVDVLSDVGGGYRSPLERRYLRDVEHRHGLPRSRRELRRRDPAHDDIVYPGFHSVVELQVETEIPRPWDTWRDNEAASNGLTVLRYGWAEVAGQPCATAAQVAKVLQRGGWVGEPHKCGRPACRLP